MNTMYVMRKNVSVNEVVLSRLFFSGSSDGVGGSIKLDVTRSVRVGMLYINISI